MKAIVKQQQLAQAIGVVARAVAHSHTACAGQHPHPTDNGRLKLSATNLELGISAGWREDSGESSLTVPPALADLVAIYPATTSHHSGFADAIPQPALRHAQYGYQRHQRKNFAMSAADTGATCR